MGDLRDMPGHPKAGDILIRQLPSVGPHTATKPTRTGYQACYCVGDFWLDGDVADTPTQALHYLGLRLRKMRKGPPKGDLGTPTMSEKLLVLAFLGFILAVGLWVAWGS